MSTITVNRHAFAPEAGRPSVFRRALARVVAAREQQAEQAVARYLLALNDVSLDALGHDRVRLTRLARDARPLI